MSRRPWPDAHGVQASGWSLFCLAILAIASSCPAVVIPANLRIPTQLVATLASPADSAMNMPTDVAVDAAGRVYVADGVNSRVAVFSRDMTFAGAILAAGDVQLSRPLGVFADAQNRLWITDTILHRVLAVATQGDGWPQRTTLLQNLELPAVQRGQTTEPADPTSVTISPDGQQVYIADDQRGRLIVRDLATGQTRTIGRPGRGLGEFEWPCQIALGPDGYLYVCEAIGARVQRINPNGRPAGQIGSWGIEAGQVYRPKGLAVATDGTMYVSDSTLHVVQAFRTDGTFLGVLTDPAGAALKFEHPMGMALDPQGRLYIVELTANRVAIVQPGHVRPAQAAIGGPATRPAGPAQAPAGGAR